MRRDVKRVSILAAMAICMATGVDANQYMTLESREGVAIANKKGLIIAPPAKGQSVAFVGSPDSGLAYGERETPTGKVIINLRTGHELLHDVEAAVYSDFPYIGVKKVGAAGYHIYNDHGQLLSPQVFEAVEPLSEELLYACQSGDWQVYQLPKVTKLDSAIEDWQAYDESRLLIGRTDKEGPIDVEEALSLDPTYDLYRFYTYKGSRLTQDEAQLLYKAGQLIQKKESLLAKKQEGPIISDQEVPREISGGAYRVKEVLAPYSEGIAFVRVEDGNQYAIDTKGNILFPVNNYVSFEPYYKGLSYVGKPAHPFSKKGKSTTMVTMGLSHGYNAHEPHKSHPMNYRMPYAKPINSTRTQDHHGIRFVPETSTSWTKGKVNYCYIDRRGFEVVSTKLEAVGPITDQGILVYNKGIYGLLNTKGQPIIPMEYSDMLFLPDQEAFIVQDRHTQAYGILSKHNLVLLPFEYDRIEPVGSRRLKAKKGNSWYLVQADPVNRNYTLSSYAYDTIDTVEKEREGVNLLTATKKDATWMIDAESGQALFSLPEGTKSVTDITHDHIVFTGHHGQGIVDRQGNIMVQPIYRTISITEELQS